jgi:hypothetical protein
LLSGDLNRDKMHSVTIEEDPILRMVRNTIDPTVLSSRILSRWYIECEVSDSGASLHIAFSIPLGNGYSALERLDRLGAATPGGARSEIFGGKWDKRWLTIMACTESEDPYDFDKTAYSVMRLIDEKTKPGAVSVGEMTAEAAEAAMSAFQQKHGATVRWFGPDVLINENCLVQVRVFKV